MAVEFKKEDYEKLLKEVADLTTFKKKSEDELLKIQMSNLEKLAALQEEAIDRGTRLKLAKEQAINEKLVSMGYEVNAVINENWLEEKIAQLDAYYAEMIEKADEANKIILQNEHDEAVAQAVQTDEDIAKQKAKLKKKQEKEDKEKIKNLAKAVAEVKPFDLAGLKDAYGNLMDEMREQAIANGADPDAKASKGSQAAIMMSLAAQRLANFTKQFEEQIKDIAYTQSEIDTRLYGSGNRKEWGSYWKAINTDIVKNVGMSVSVKQEDVVNNLKTLVGKGIAFNVEQRAFVDTISDKIATTFEAADNTLLKLVRIQQADTTAARLGMEAALNAFLNNMYETTEYMTDAAASIRSQLYEASALMGAAEGTAFEFQVQKWMGSLYSVGFSNTEGLAGALGKLAAGDISGITEGGYGNLLVMAANRANLSIAEILADGLDDSETNQLLQSMVEYLQEIYSETKNSKVVAQQFANVYGLTASDLKAAANLYGSTKTIGGNNLGYTGMLANLQNMANSMYSRMGMGEMLENLKENFKYATSANMANNPILYGLFTFGNMLKDTTGGIKLPDIGYLGTKVNLNTTVADLMLATSLGGGFLSGIGQMIYGLASNGFGGMLKGFGITGNGLTTVTRGSGTGLQAISGGALSESGTMASNSDASDIQNKTVGDATEEGNQKVEAASEESKETKLADVNENVIAIYNLLSDAIIGINKLHVEIDAVDPLILASLIHM